MANKYNSRKTVVDGITFDSKREAVRYTELLKKERDGLIQGLQRQMPFVLLERYEIEGRKVREIVYKADFVYYENGVKVIEDVKGYVTKEFAIKKKMFEKRYGKLTITK